MRRLYENNNDCTTSCFICLVSYLSRKVSRFERTAFERTAMTTDQKQKLREEFKTHVETIVRAVKDFVTGKITREEREKIFDREFDWFLTRLESIEKEVAMEARREERTNIRDEYAKRCLENYEDPGSKEWYKTRFQYLYDLIKDEKFIWQLSPTNESEGK